MAPEKKVLEKEIPIGNPPKQISASKNPSVLHIKPHDQLKGAVRVCPGPLKLCQVKKNRKPKTTKTETLPIQVTIFSFQSINNPTYSSVQLAPYYDEGILDTHLQLQTASSLPFAAGCNFCFWIYGDPNGGEK